MTRILLVATLAAAACSPAPVHPTPAGSAPATELAARVDALVEAAIRDHSLVGASVIVAHAGDTLIAKGYGLADVEHHIAATPGTIYRIGSVTKQFTAVAILQLAERGQLALHDDITKYLTDYPTHGKTITIEHLLTHTSGIPNYTDAPDWPELSMRPMPRAALVATFSAKPLDFAPGERFAYSNSNYYLLGLIIEHVTKRPYAEVIRDQVLRPAHMAASGYCDDAMPHRALGYAIEAGTVVAAKPLDMAHPFAAGALCSTVGDLLAWQRALDGGALLHPDSLAKMRTPMTLADGTSTHYGYGLFVSELAGHARIAHGGGINGFTSELARYPTDDVTVVVLANAEVITTTTLEKQIARAAMGIAEPSRTATALGDADRQRYVGDYQIDGPDGKPLIVRVFDEAGTLRTQVTGQPAATMIYKGDDRFVLDFDPSVELVFQHGELQAPSFTLHQGGMTIEARRKG